MQQNISSTKNLHIYRSTDQKSGGFAFHIILLRGPCAENPGEYGAASLAAMWIGIMAEKILGARADVSVWGSSIRISIETSLEKAQNLPEFAAAIFKYSQNEHEACRKKAEDQLAAACASDAIQFHNNVFSKRWIGCASEMFRTHARAAALKFIRFELVRDWLARNWNCGSVTCVGVTENAEALRQMESFCAGLPTANSLPFVEHIVAPAQEFHAPAGFVGISAPIPARAGAKEFWMAQTLAEHIQLIIPEPVEITTYKDAAGSALLFWTHAQHSDDAAVWIAAVIDVFQKVCEWNLFEEEMIRENFRTDFETLRIQSQSDAGQLEMIIDNIRMRRDPIDSRISFDAIEYVTDADIREFAKRLFDKNFVQVFC